MDVEFDRIKSGEKSRIILSLSKVIEVQEGEELDNEYKLQSGVMVVTDYGSTYFLLINFDEFIELYERMMRTKIVNAR